MSSSRNYAAIASALAVAVCIGEHAHPAKSVGGANTPRERLIRDIRRPDPRPEFHIRHQSATESSPNQGIIQDSPHPGSSQSPGVSAPPPSPGIAIGTTWYEVQHTHSQGRRIARNSGDDRVQMVWDGIQNFDPSGVWNDHEVLYNSYVVSTQIMQPGFGGGPISLDPITRGGFGNIAVDDDGTARTVLHQFEDLALPMHPWSVWVLVPGTTMHVDDDLAPSGPCGEALWPKVDVRQRSGAPDIVHAIARSGTSCDVEHLFYWRFDGALWSGPALIDSSFSPGYVIAADNNSDNVAIIFHDIDEPQRGGANNISYYRSTTTGLGWSSGAELGPSFKRMLTSYNDTLNGPQAWKHIAAAYDNSGALHIVWDEQQLANQTASVAIRHWNDLRGTIRPVTLGYWTNPHPQTSLNLANLSLGIGDGSTSCDAGSNLDFLYVIYTQYGGITVAEQADVSLPPGAQSSHYNGEIYLTASNSGGNTWAQPLNLTQTQTPRCNPAVPDSVCRSEDWATINKVVSDIDILYISDHDAGAAPQGEGTYQPNDVMYLRIPGGTADAQHFCPVIDPGYAAVITQDAACEYHAAPGEIKSDEIFTILNLGNAALEGEVSILPGASWLTVTGSGPYVIPAGSPDLTLSIVMDAASLSEGLYTGTIRITHNDPDIPSPQDYPISFFVISDFNCAQGAVISTGVE